MPRIVSVGKALPPFKLTQEEIRQFVSALFKDSDMEVERLLDVFANAEIKERYFSVPIEWYQKERSFQEKNETYVRSATELSVAAIKDCLRGTNTGVTDIDYIIFVSTTGLATPSIDARLINILKFRPDIRRTPVWGLGCAGGAAGLSQAYHYLLGHPRERVLLVAVELCGLTFQQNDFSKSNFVATALFGEGAAAVLMTGDDSGADGPEILGTSSTFWPDSLDIMGWNVLNSGMQVIFNRNIPNLVEKHARDNFAALLARYDMQLENIKHLIIHPGGIKVIEAYKRSLGLSNGQMDTARRILRDYGNMSSVSVLFVLAEYLEAKHVRAGDHGLISALGPGFCAENLLIQF